MDLGTVVGGYRILELIGEGGMGTVFRGVDVMLEREVALKLLRPELTYQPDIVKRFQKEAITLARLNHQHIVTLHHMFRDGDKNFMVLEFVRGETLDDLIKRCGPIPWQTAVPLICQALQGLEHAHILKIIHRDIKPSNLILTQTGIVKLMDFGVARMLETSGITQSGNVVGTLRYMSPEQVQGKPLDVRTDIYGIGMVLYEMLTAHAPFSKTTEYELTRALVEDPPAPPRSFVPHIPKRLEAVLLRALAKAPEDRYASAGELRAELENLMNEALAGPSLTDDNGRTASRSPWRDHRLWDDRRDDTGERTRPHLPYTPTPKARGPARIAAAALGMLRQPVTQVIVGTGLVLSVAAALFWADNQLPPAGLGPSAPTASLPVEPAPQPVQAQKPATEPVPRPAPVQEPVSEPAPPPPLELEPEQSPAPPASTPAEIVAPSDGWPASPAADLASVHQSLAKPVKRKAAERRRKSGGSVDGGWEIISK